MQFTRRWLVVVAGGLILAAMTCPLHAQSTTQLPHTQLAAPTTQSNKAGRFAARIFQGTAFSVPNPARQDKGKRQFLLAGPVWDGVNKGLWILRLAEDSDSQSPGKGPSYVAVLLEPATGQEKARVPALSRTIVTHDGVGLWFYVRGSGSAVKNTGTLRRVRTAPDISPSQKANNLVLPEDVPSQIRMDSLRIVPTAPPVAVSSFPAEVLGKNARSTYCLFRFYLDSQTGNLYGQIGTGSATHMALGAGYFWFYDGALGRLSLATIKPAAVSADNSFAAAASGAADLTSLVQSWQIEGNAPQLYGITWDGQQLWSLSEATAETAAPPLKPIERKAGMASFHLVSIDVGFTRKPDTTARYQKALAFEKAKGTLKALPIFEQIFSDDPSAAEVRNHVAWALAARPQEPYHNLNRALELVNEAIQWQPWNPEMWDTLAEIYWRKGDAKLAVHLEAKAINLNPHKAFYWRQYEKFQAGPTTQEAMEPSY